MNDFLVGAALAVAAPYYLSALLVPQRTYSLRTYAWLAPLYLGLVSVASAQLAPHVPLRRRLFWTGNAAFAVTLTLVGLLTLTGQPPYRFDNVEWLTYALYLYALYFYAWNVVAYALLRS